MNNLWCCIPSTFNIPNVTNKDKILFFFFLFSFLPLFQLQKPSNIIAQRKFSPARDPCSVLWDVLWNDLMTMELTHGKKDHPQAPPSRLIIYLKTRATELKEQVRVIKCNPETNQAFEVYVSIEQAANTYGSNLSKVGFQCHMLFHSFGIRACDTVVKVYTILQKHCQSFFFSSSKLIRMLQNVWKWTIKRKNHAYAFVASTFLK